MKQRFPLFLFALLMALDVAVFLMQKRASDAAVAVGGGYLWTIVTHLWAWTAIALAPLQLWTWTRILARADISYAYPLTALSVPLTMLASTLVLGERAPWPVWLGAGLITLGAALLRPSEAHAAPPPETPSKTLA